MAENIPPLLSTQPLQEVHNVTRRIKHERSWKEEEIETLIGLYEERVFLWDFGSEEYINRDGKDLAYEQIDEEMKKYRARRAMFPRKCFPVCAAWKHNIHFVSRAFAPIMSNNVSATMCSRLPVPLRTGGRLQEVSNIVI